MSFKAIGSLVCMGLLVMAARTGADELVVEGVVTGADEALVEGAIVTVGTGWGGSGDVVADTTDAEGRYSIATTVEASFGGTAAVGMTVTAEGYRHVQDFVTVSDADDGEPDMVEQDFVLSPAGSADEVDTLVVTGTVLDETDEPIEGAEVVVIPGFADAQQQSGLTDAAGAYRVELVNTGAASGGAVTVSAPGFRDTRQYFRIDSPSDGTTDIVEEDFVLTALTYDTLSVIGTVIDAETSEPIEGATVTVTAGGGGWGGGERTGTEGESGADGTFSISLVTEQLPERVFWSVTADGYQADEGRAEVSDQGVADVEMVELALFTSSDNVSYTVSGTVTDEQGDGIGGATVVVTLSRDGADFFVDTVTTVSYGFVRGRYQARTESPYVEGEITVTVQVSAEDFVATQESETVAASTADIIIDVQLSETETGVVRRPLAGRRMAVPTKIYRLDGRLVGIIDKNTPGGARSGTGQVLIITKGASRTVRGIVGTR